MPTVEVRDFSDSNVTYELVRAQPMSIGRHVTNDICIADESVPPMACRITWTGTVVSVAAATPDGVDVDGKLVAQCELRHGSVLRIGPADLRILFSERDASAKNAARPAGESAEESRKSAEETGARRESKHPAGPVSEEVEILDDGTAANEDDLFADLSSLNAKKAEPEVLKPAQPTGVRALRERLLGPPVRPGDQNVVRSPFVLTLSIVIVVLLLAAATFWFIIGRESTQRRYDAAVAELQAGRYAQAIAMLEEFLDAFPTHRLADDVRLTLGQAKVEQLLAGTSPQWQPAMKALDKFIRNHRDTSGFPDRSDALAKLGGAIAKGAAEAAEQQSDRTLLAVSEEASIVLERFSPVDAPPTQLLKSIEQTRRRAVAAIRKTEGLAKGLGEINQALAHRSALTAVATRRNVLDQYPQFASLPELQASLAETTALEKELTVRVDSDAEPDDLRNAAAPADSAAAKVVFAAHAHSIGSETSGERFIWSHAKGSCFALDANNGKILWRRPTGWQQPFFPVEAAGVREGVLLYADVSDDSGQLLYLTRDQGTVLWALTVRNDRPVGQPLIHENQIYLATESGRLLRIDLDTGVPNDELRFTQRLATGPILLQDDESLLLAGNDAFLYTCSTHPLECRVVTFLDHRGGSVTAPLLRMAGLVLVSENDRTDSTKLAVLDYQNVESAAPVLAEARVTGHVRDEPALRGRDLFVPTSGERVFAYRVSDEPGQAVLSPVGSYQTATDHPAAIYLHTGPEGQLWANGSRLRRFELDTEGFRLLPQEAAIGAAAQPLQSWGNFLYVGRYPGWSQAVVISQVEREEMISRWRTVVGAAIIAWLDRPGGLLGITETGEVFLLGEQAIRQGGFQQTPFETLEIPAGVRRSLRATPISNDQLAIDLAGPKPRLDVLGSDGRVRTSYPLDQPLTASPVRMGTDLVVALPGRLRVLPAVKPTEPTRDLVLPVDEGETPQIVQLFALDEQQILAVDSTGRLRRIQRRDQPSPHLAVAGDTQLGQPPTFAGVRGGENVVLADAAGLVQAFDVASLEPIAEISLGSPPASDIWKLEDRYFIETSDGRLIAFEVTPEARIVWTLPLQQGEHLLGPPLPTGEDRNSILVASVGGSVVQVSQDTGKVQSRTRLSQSLQLPLRPFGESILATFVDGTATLLDVDTLTADQAAE